MGGALARGLAQGSIIPTSNIYVSNPSTAKLMALKERFPEINITTDNSSAARVADIVVLAVKPWKVAEVKMPWLSYIVGTVSDHTLTLHGEEISLRELCGRNSKVAFSVEK